MAKKEILLHLEKKSSINFNSFIERHSNKVGRITSLNMKIKLLKNCSDGCSEVNINQRSLIAVLFFQLFHCNDDGNQKYFNKTNSFPMFFHPHSVVFVDHRTSEARKVLLRDKSFHLNIMHGTFSLFRSRW